MGSVCLCESTYVMNASSIHTNTFVKENAKEKQLRQLSATAQR